MSVDDVDWPCGYGALTNIAHALEHAKVSRNVMKRPRLSFFLEYSWNPRLYIVPSMHSCSARPTMWDAWNFLIWIVGHIRFVITPCGLGPACPVSSCWWANDTGFLEDSHDNTTARIISYCGLALWHRFADTVYDSMRRDSRALQYQGHKNFALSS